MVVRERSGVSMTTWTWGKSCVLLAAGALTQGCSASVAVTPPPPGAGTAILDWTINETKDPGECAANGAATFRVSLVGSAGASAGTFLQDCTAFATTIDGLLPDTYTGSANLLDTGGGPRTTSVSLAPFGVIGGTTVTVAVDFPQSSFF
jgi:hypothetical protein